MDKLKVVVVSAILILGFFVALSPGVVYAPTPKIILYFLVSFLPGLLFGAEVTSKFDLKLPGFCFTTAGACAVCFGALVLLTTLSKPEAQIAVYHVFDQKGQKVRVDLKDTLEIPLTARGIEIARFVQDNTVILLFPEQVGEAELIVRPTKDGPTYRGKVGYAGTRISNLFLGKQLQQDVP